jgi:hypothetical protein
MTPEGTRVLQAIARTERTTPLHCLPLKKIATSVLDGNTDLARAVLSDLDERGFLHGNSEDLQSGWLTSKGRSCLRDE